MAYELVNYEALLSLELAKREYSSIFIQCGLAQDGRNVSYYPAEGGMLKCYRQVTQKVGAGPYAQVQYTANEKESTYLMSEKTQPIGLDQAIWIEQSGLVSIKTTSGKCSYVFPGSAAFDSDEYFQMVKMHTVSDAERAIEALDAQLYLKIMGSDYVTRFQWDETAKKFNSTPYTKIDLENEPTYHGTETITVNFTDDTKTPQEKFRGLYDSITKRIMQNANASGATSALSPNDNNYFLCSDPLYRDILKVAVETATDLKVHNNRSFTAGGITFVSIIYQYLNDFSTYTAYPAGLLVTPKAIHFGFMRQKLDSATVALAESLQISLEAAATIGLYTETVEQYNNSSGAIPFIGRIYQPYAVGSVCRTSSAAVTKFIIQKLYMNNHPTP